MDKLEKLYSKPLPSSRSGALYNTFPYPTKISPEAIAIYIACTTNPGDTVLDAFAGSGSTGIAALLCEHPTKQMIESAKKMGVNPIWGARNAVLYEIGTYPSFATKTLLNRLTKNEYDTAVNDFINKAKKSIGYLYSAKDPNGDNGLMRYSIWSELLICPNCNREISYFEYGTSRNPVKFHNRIMCPNCHKTHPIDSMAYATENYYDHILNKVATRKKRVLAWVYGTTNGKNWDRPANIEDSKVIEKLEATSSTSAIPQEIQWGELHRAGYHFGVTHLHHFYSTRNYIVMLKLWNLTEQYPERISNALKLLLLSYNASHCTLMTRVVAKKNAKDFVLTSAQSGVLYISKLPVEKNIILGLQRKAKSFSESYELLQKCTGSVVVHNTSSTSMEEKDGTIDFVFTDPPFGDFIPYAEVNQINELWLDNTTKREKEVIISASQGKGTQEYQDLLTNVFSEINRVLKPGHYASIVFHSSKAKVWDAFGAAITDAGLQIVLTNILDKTQSSFKQVVSNDSVQGDPIFLAKANKPDHRNAIVYTDKTILQELLSEHHSESGFDKRRFFSLYVGMCLEQGVEIALDAKEVYSFYEARIKELI